MRTQTMNRKATLKTLYRLSKGADEYFALFRQLSHGKTVMPMESFIKRTINDSARVMEAIFEEDRTTDDLIDELASLAAGMNPVVRDVRRVIGNREE